MSAPSGGTTANAASCAAWITSVTALSQTTTAAAPRNPPRPPNSRPTRKVRSASPPITASCAPASANGCASSVADVASTGPPLIRTVR
jgi:hypothetical protein